MNHIYSTLTCDNAYTVYEKTAGGLTIPKAEIVVNGGAGLANKYLITPLGTVTTVSDDELALLKTNPVFVEHVKNGFLVVQEGGKANDAEKVASNMSYDHGSAPLTEQDAEKANVKTSEKGK